MKQALSSRRAARAQGVRFAMRPVALALACMGAAPAMAQILPTWNNFTVRGGAVNVGMPTAGGSVLPITQTTQRAIVDWQGFSIGVGNAVNITQPAATSILLNRVTGGGLSTIAGSLTANGRVFLVNPSGVLFTGTSSVNVGGLVASTLQMGTSNDAFMGGTESFQFNQQGGLSGRVENQGSITATGGGTVALIGADVRNSGRLVANHGTAGLVSADGVTIDFAGDGLTTFKVSPGLFSSVLNSGTVQADGGRVVLMATAGSEVAQGVVNVDGVLRARSLSSRNGEIALDSGSAPAGITLAGGEVTVAGHGEGVKGGTITATGQGILIGSYTPIDETFSVLDPATLDASGKAGGGSITLRASAVAGAPDTGAIAMTAGSTLRADATGTGNGGQIQLLGERTLRAYGTLSARGGPGGGDGGFIETSGGFAVPAGDTNGGIELLGLRTDASAPAGRAGTWLIDPFDVTIVNGAAAGTLPTNPFDPIATSTVQDGDINAALNAGTGVTITTGTSGPATAGNVNFGGGVLIDRTVGTAPLTFEVDANLGINALNTNATIRSSAGPLNVVFNAGLGALPDQNGNIGFNGVITTNGGDVVMNARSRDTGASPIILNNTQIDTRIGQLDTNPGGSVSITGTRSPTTGVFNNVVQITDTTIQSSTGNVSITGIGGTNGTGVQMISTVGANAVATSVSTTLGAIRITGVGSGISSSGIVSPGYGIEINGTTLRSTDGDIVLHGLHEAAAIDGGGNGVAVVNSSVVTALGSGNIEITGASQGADPGVLIGAATAVTGSVASRVDGNHNVVLRAATGGAGDALDISGTVRAGNVLDLRPGGVDALGNASDLTANPITLGGTAASGFAISADEFTRITAGTIVAGSNLHAGGIDVVGPLALASPLTLQNGGGGNITLGAPVATPQLGLLSGGNITQAAGATITAGTLLARSSGGNVLLNEPGNDVGTVAGGAAGRFEYTDANALTLGSATVTGYDAASNLPQPVSATSMAAGSALVRTLTGDLSLGTNVSTTGGADLVAAARFQNLAAYTIAGAPWRVWADTWIGETRGGLFGSGLLPNLYHCAYLGLCGVTVSATDNHFIYVQQPTATVVIGDASRRGGLPNPPFIYSITGLILGDTAAGLPGFVSSPAGPASPPGVYPINGVFASAAGYAVNVIPGQLVVGGFVQLPMPDVLRDLPNTWTYDRNIGPPPICFATGPLEGDRADQGGDILAREWTRVRSRPNLTSCVDTERRNGCADF
ncbi:beta strand repeat-containing protein [Variovorax sp. PBL-E5]|uniref:beta strand repeat-containing protein n=1 Tax=Variovorax sp. PBL-E5 TaxID=434014 RepID=UPI001316B43B|nr:filamentous hemagglutinin N-terminal domain-containing protein [Variovorax sp. PBL-E5]VTU39044.1 Heme:hemopexin utilization protein A [Variovorax sp. PBL-E5]